MYDKEYHKKWRLANPDYQKKWEEKNSEYRKEYYKNYEKSHAVERKMYRKLARPERRIYEKNKRDSDVNYRLALNLRIRINKAINGIYKAGSAICDLDCSVEQLKYWIEQQFQPGMNWSNYGEWQIDHIIPLSAVDLTDRKQLKKVCHWFNLRPLWRKENISRGNRI